MKILVACEESQTVCKAFRARGHEAYSADIQEPTGGHPEWHMETIKLPAKERAKARSKTFPGIAAAMAEQWGCLHD